MRIIGIKLKDGEKPVIKNLKPGSWYPFGDYQEPMEQNGWRWNKDENSDKYLNKLYKSSADERFSNELDLMFRIINNFAYVLLERTIPSSQKQKRQHNGHDLSEAKGFSAKLYFETDNKLGCIEYSYGKVKYYYYSIDKPGMEEYSFIKYTSINKLHLLLNDFFYTICSNYSIYSFNKNDYETKCLFDLDGVPGVNGNWIHGLLHKNDGEGYIDLNNERALAAQRLSTLAVLFRSQNKWFMGEYSATRIAYQFDEDAQTRYEKKFGELVDKNLTLNAKYPESFGTVPLAEVFKEAWCSYLDRKSYFNKRSDNTLKNTVVAYLCYKTLKICLTYPSYGSLLGLRTITEEELKEKNLAVVAPNALVIETNVEELKVVIRKMAKLDDDNHILLKLRQCLTFLKRNYYEVDPQQHIMGDKDASLGLKMVGIDKFVQDNLKIDHKQAKGKKEKKRKNYQTYDEVFLRMPPSIFKWEVRFRKRKSQEEVPLEKLSSGERQILQEFSYLLYHIKNIESVENDNYRQHYHHVNIVLDEAELYFHPEFQRQMVANLIDMLSWCHIDNRKIRSANIMIVTHSPFVLSDIPANRMLYLEEGERVEKKDQTFAANYHDLLYNQFIIRSTMGAVAEKAIKQIDKLYKEERTLQPKEHDYHKFIASTVAEKYIREYLLGELDSMKPDQLLSYEENKVSE